MLFSDSRAVLDISLQPFNAFTAAVEPVSRSRRRSGPAAAPSSASHSSPHVQPVKAAAAVPQPLARAAPAVAPPQPSEQARSHATPPPPDSSFATERAAASILSAGVAASSTPAPGPASHPIALSREDYHARYATTHPTRGQKWGKAPTPATSQVQQPESAGAAPKQSEQPRPTTPSMPAPTASQTSVASASSSTIIAPAQKSPKLRKSRPRKRRTEDVFPPAVSVAKQASTSVEVVSRPAPRAATKPDAATSSTASALTAEYYAETDELRLARRSASVRATPFARVVRVAAPSTSDCGATSAR